MEEAMTEAEAPEEVNPMQLVAIEDAPITYKTLQVLATSPTIPEIYQGKPNDMLAVALVGREVGVGAMTAINNIDMIDGTISMRAKFMSALIHGAGHIIKTLEQTADLCKIECHRWHSQSGELIQVGIVEFAWEDAERSGDAKKGTYKKYPRAMLTNRALTLAARTFYADVLAGIGYTPDEVGHMPPEVIMDLELEEEEIAREFGGEVVEAELVEDG